MGTLGIIFHDSIDGPWEEARGHLREELEQLRLGLQTLMNASSPVAPSAGTVRTKKVVLTDAQIKALPTTPVKLIPATGLGTRLVFLFADAVLDASAGAYGGVTDGSYMSIEWTPFEIRGSNHLGDDSTTTPPLSELTDFLTNGDKRRVGFVPYSQAVDLAQPNAWGNAAHGEVITVASENVALDIRISLAGGNLTGGDPANSLTINLFYVII